jgi:hypothetical protein
MFELQLELFVDRTLCIKAVGWINELSFEFESGLIRTGLISKLVYSFECIFVRIHLFLLIGSFQKSAYD